MSPKFNSRTHTLPFGIRRQRAFMRKFSVLFKGMSTVNSVKTPPEEDFYAILGVAKNASEQEIKNAYRKLALKCKFFGIELCV